MIAALFLAALFPGGLRPLPTAILSPGSDIAPAAPDPAAARQERFVYLLRTYPERPPVETFKQVTALIDEGPFAERDRAEYWLGSAALSADDKTRARQWFARLARDYPGSVWEERSWLGLGDASAKERDYGPSLSFYERARQARDPAVRELAGISGAQILVLRVRQRVAWACAVFGLCVALFFAASARRGPWLPLPAEARIVLPVLGVLSLLALRIDAQPRKAILMLCAGGAALAVLSGTRLRALRPGRAGRALHALLAVAALGCVAYYAVYEGDLIGMVQETFRAGPE